MNNGKVLSYQLLVCTRRNIIMSLFSSLSGQQQTAAAWLQRCSQHFTAQCWTHRHCYMCPMMLLPGCRRHLRRPVLSFSRHRGTPRRRFSGDKPSPETSDLVLHNNYGLIPRLHAAGDVLFYDKEKFNRYHKATAGLRTLNKLLVFSDLEHPLFSKYNFDVSDFMEGALQAFDMIYDSVLCSPNFKKYVKNTIEAEDIDIPSFDGEDNVDPEKNEESAYNKEKINDSTYLHPVSFLKSVCTEKGFRDIVKVGQLDLNDRDRSHATAVFGDNELISHDLYRAIILPQVKSSQFSHEEEYGEDIDIAEHSDTAVELVANIGVTYSTTCNIGFYNESSEPVKVWKSKRTFSFIFSGVLGNKETEWKVSGAFIT